MTVKLNAKIGVKGFGCLQSVITKPLKPFGQDMLNHSTDKNIHVHRFNLLGLCQMIIFLCMISYLKYRRSNQLP